MLQGFSVCATPFAEDMVFAESIFMKFLPDPTEEKSLNKFCDYFFR